MSKIRYIELNKELFTNNVDEDININALNNMYFLNATIIFQNISLGVSIENENSLFRIKHISEKNLLNSIKKEIISDDSIMDIILIGYDISLDDVKNTYAKISSDNDIDISILKYNEVTLEDSCVIVLESNIISLTEEEWDIQKQNIADKTASLRKEVLKKQTLLSEDTITNLTSDINNILNKLPSNKKIEVNDDIPEYKYMLNYDDKTSNSLSIFISEDNIISLTNQENTIDLNKDSFEYLYTMFGFIKNNLK